ncbi:MAG: acyl-CoA dehydrogenase family protein [Myxococcales bacterium]|nr:acyl-CoA dehydrogenase family protein [Myxococcales bacterium]
MTEAQSPKPAPAAYRRLVRTFIKEHIEPVEVEYLRANQAANPGADHRTWQVLPVVEELKAKAKAAGLWNLFLPDAEHGAGLTTREYAPLAEETGRSFLAAEVFNCNAPDTGNMEVLHRYGSEAQKREWLMPLLDGRIRSVFAMTEPDVASSDATNMQATAVVEGDEVVLNGKKWWTTGLGDPRAKVAIFMGRTPNPGGSRHQQHSMVLVPLDTKGVNIIRMLPVFGEYDAPQGHGEVHFDNVRVPASNIIAGPGRGFEIAQGRLGPGRIHHCMRCIGAAERALELTIDRGLSRTAFGKPIINLGGNRERVAKARIAIDQARLLTLHAAEKLDAGGPMAAMTEIAAIKVVAPSMLQDICDFAIQIHGGAGLSHDTPLAGLFAAARALRLADGPDEVHLGLIARLELAKAKMRQPK